MSQGILYYLILLEKYHTEFAFTDFVVLYVLRWQLKCYKQLIMMFFSVGYVLLLQTTYNINCLPFVYYFTIFCNIQKYLIYVETSSAIDEEVEILNIRSAIRQYKGRFLSESRLSWNVPSVKDRFQITSWLLFLNFEFLTKDLSIPISNIENTKRGPEIRSPKYEANIW